jgi:hypothetical protein
MATAEMNHALELHQKPLTAVEIRAQVNLIQEVMQAVMKKDVHYGTIPGCRQPSLYKPGSEKILSTFRIAIEPIVEDLSTEDVAHFRVITRATSTNGQFLGAGVGEASSEEEKYKWREMVCQEEFDSLPETRRRIKYKKGREGSFYTVYQVRTEVADIANTVLKMAKKRSQIDVTLTVTAASDIFAQDIEDIPEEMRESLMNEGEVAAPDPLPEKIERKAEAPKQGSTQEFRQAVAKPAAQAPRPTPVPPRAQNVRTISDAQGRRFYAIWKGANRTQEEVREYLRSRGVENGDSRKMPFDIYEECCTWAEGKF